MAINEEKLNQFVHKAVCDIGATYSAALMVIGEELGLYKAMAELGPVTSQQLARSTDTSERYVREWLAAQAAGGYAGYDAETECYSLSEEQAFALADENSPAYLPGGFLIAVSALRIVPKIIEAFRTGEGVGWHEHDPGMFRGVESFFRPGYRVNLMNSWIPALAGVQAKLEQGASVADVGCGHGASTILMAQAFPNSRFAGFDFHEPSIKRAREAASDAGVSDRVKFEVARSHEYPGDGYDLVAVFDCLHDMGDPVGAAAHVLKSLNKDGTWMIVEPYAGDKVEDNLNPVGQVYYGASTLICTPASLAQDVGLALGAQAGEARLRAVTEKGGFTRFRRAAETPFNIVFEARP